MKTASRIFATFNSLTIVLFFILVVQRCAPESPMFDITAARKEVDEANRNFMDMLAKGDSIGIAGLYTTDAKMMAPNVPAIVGRAGIQSGQSHFINTLSPRLQISTLDLWGTADMLAEEGEYVMTTKDGAPIDKGKYIVIWKKEDGKWKIFRDMINSDLPMPGM